MDNNTWTGQQQATNITDTWPWSYCSWIYNYICNQCISPLMLWVRISIRARSTVLCDKVCRWLATDRWCSPCPPVSSTNKTDRHDIAEILSKVALNTIKQTNKHIADTCMWYVFFCFGYLVMPFGFLAPENFWIIWLCNLLNSGVNDGGYFRNTSWELN
jgi:hypothetical protein